MQSTGLTKEQKEYNDFDKRSKILLYTLFSFVPVIVIWLVASMFCADENGIPALIATIVLFAYTALFIVISVKLSNKRNRLHLLAYSKDEKNVRTGLFKDLWNEFEQNNFTWEYDGKTFYVEPYADSILFYFKRNKQYYTIEIDAKELYLNCESNSDGCREKYIPLQAFDNVDDVFSAIREFIEE